MTALLALAALAALGSVGAAAEDDEPVAKPPPFDGAMGFQAIQGPEGPESFAWTVHLDEEQELVQVDDRHAVVLYKEPGQPPRTAFGITATAAHDAIGTDVPTTLAVSEGDVITLTVHHRSGDPAAGDAPFDYPIIAGVGWEGGFQTHIVTLPPGERDPVAPPPTCVVPKLTGRTLAASRARLINSSCALGAVRGKRGKAARVVKQFRAPGTVLSTGARVAVKLGG